MDVGTKLALAIVVVNLAAFQQQMTDAEVENAHVGLRVRLLCLRRRQVRTPIAVGEDPSDRVLNTDIADVPSLMQQ